MELRMRNVNILGVHWKIRFLGERGRSRKTNTKGWGGGRDCLKMEAWTVCRFKGRGQEIEGWCLRGVVNTPMHTMYHDVLS